MKALQVPASETAKAFYAAHQQFLQGQERLVKTEFLEIVKIIEDDQRAAADKQLAVLDILKRSEAEEKKDLQTLQEAQQAFAKAHNLPLP
jgi:uncharacterized protein YbcC (UPF0753/DUF2309 family)